MPNPEHLDLIKSGTFAWNDWKKKNDGIRIDLSHARIDRADLMGADLSGVDLTGANLSRADLRIANFYRANLNNANLNQANLIGAYFRWANLNEAKLRGAALMEASFAKASAKKATFIEADLTNAMFNETNLRGACFLSAELRGANFRDAILATAYLKRASLKGITFNSADLTDADLRECAIGWTSFSNVNLSRVKGLETVRHVGPSTIGIDTLFLSGGNVPDSFLVGTGLPDTFLAFVRSHVGAEQALQFYSCFISYSHQDEDFAKRLYSRMRDANIRVWFAPEDIKGGEKLRPQIDHAILYHDKILIVLSENSLRSEWVITEVRKALQEEIASKRRKLFPIRLVDFDSIRSWECFDSDTGKDMAKEVREYYIPDFSSWKDHDSFENAFQKLVKDLSVGR